MTIANWITFALVAVTLAALIDILRRSRATAATARLIASFTDRDHEALRTGWEIQRMASHVVVDPSAFGADGPGGCTGSSHTMQLDGKTLWVTVSRDPVHFHPQPAAKDDDDFVRLDRQLQDEERRARRKERH